MNFKKTAIAAALSTSMGITVTAEAAIITADWDGLFTLLNPSAVPVQNTSYPYYSDPTWGYGLRTQISGTFTFDTDTGAGSATINNFGFFASGPVLPHDIVIQAVGDGFGGAGTMVVGSMLYDWEGNLTSNVGIVLDAAGFFDALPTSAGSIISGVGVLPASDGMLKGKYPIGPTPMATSAFDTNFHNDPTCVLTASCLITDATGIGGSPMDMDNGLFPNFNHNFDITSIHVTSVTSEVPIPAAAWLLGSGLLGLVGMCRRRRREISA